MPAPLPGDGFTVTSTTDLAKSARSKRRRLHRLVDLQADHSETNSPRHTSQCRRLPPPAPPDRIATPRAPLASSWRPSATRRPSWVRAVSGDDCKPCIRVIAIDTDFYRIYRILQRSIRSETAGRVRPSQSPPFEDSRDQLGKSLSGEVGAHVDRRKHVPSCALSVTNRLTLGMRTDPGPIAIRTVSIVVTARRVSTVSSPTCASTRWARQGARAARRWITRRRLWVGGHQALIISETRSSASAGGDWKWHPPRGGGHSFRLPGHLPGS
jgi:hypothetical protein